MPEITYQNKVYRCNDNETVLQCFFRHSVAVPSSCEQGSCQTCMMRAIQGNPGSESQKGLKNTLVASNHFLACQCSPVENIEVALADEGISTSLNAVVESKVWLSSTVIQLRLKCEELQNFHAGQFINLSRGDGLTRSYSLACPPNSDNTIDLHIRTFETGEMTTWVQNKLSLGDIVTVNGPHGSCYYIGDNKDQPMLLLGTGTGLAPLWGIIQDAIQQGHRGNVELIHGSYNTAGLYLVDELLALEKLNNHFKYTPCVDTPDHGMSGLAVGRIDEIVSDRYASLAGWRVFICGAPEMVKNMQRQVFLAGASMSDIYIDAFG